MDRHPNAKLDDARWLTLFGRWHAGERADALRAEAGVSHDTWSANARRLGMRLKDLPADHPGRRRTPPFAARADDYRHPNSLLSEGEWRALFRLRAMGEAAGADDMAGGEAAGGGGALGGVAIDLRDANRTRASFEASIVAAGARADFVGVTLRCRAKLSVERALFEGRSGPGPFHPVGGVEEPAEDGAAAAPLVLRPSQTAPEGDWSTWLFLGGRGAGKTLAGASWLADQARSCGRLALVGATLHDAREVMIGGPSGILSLPRWRRAAGCSGAGGWDGPVYEPSRRRLRFPNGAEAWVFSAEDPDSLRGPQFAAAWADEFCAWGGGGRGPAHRGGGETLALLRMGLRMRGAAGARPRLVVTTTPRPIQALRELRAEPGCVETHAPTAENAAWLAPEFLAGLDALYGGTRRAAQELEGLVVEIEGGLFTAAMLAAARGAGPAGFDRVVVGVDPTATTTGDACGIVVAGRRRRADGTREAWVLADRSAAGLTPEGWTRRALAAARDFAADAIVAEVNQGGDMVKAVFRAARAAGEGPPLKTVRAAEGKRARAEPVAALYEQGRVRHAGPFPQLEEELMALGGEDEGRMSLDRADALVWAVSALMLNGDGHGPSIRAL